MIVLAVVAMFVAIGNHFNSPGPLFYQQDRVGRAENPSWFTEFRLDDPDAEAETGAVWATTNDDRITPVGRFLRKARLDELPPVYPTFSRAR